MEPVVEDVAQIQPLWLIVLVGALSGVIASVVGPIVVRVFTRNDRALDVRQAWVREKLQSVFGEGDVERTGDDPVEYFTRLVPPSGYTPHELWMHDINWAVGESVDYKLLHPRRSRLAQKWLSNWHNTLEPEANGLHATWHQQRESEDGVSESWEKANGRYEKRVRKAKSALSIWATGQWLTHSSLWLWWNGSNWYHRWQRWGSRHWLPSFSEEQGAVACDCVNEELVADMHRGYPDDEGVIRKLLRLLRNAEVPVRIQGHVEIYGEQKGRMLRR